jgi:hypothetical protein
MQITRRQALQHLAIACAACSVGLTGCFSIDQTTIAALLSEMVSAWQALETALGKVIPTNIANLFAQAIAAVKAWVPGTPVQDVIQILQDLSTAVGGLSGIGLTALETAAVQIVLNTIINVIELIDPASVPATALTAQARFKRSVSTTVLVPQKHFRQGQIPSSELKKQFESEWLAQTGKAAA